MARETKTGEEIQAEVARLVHGGGDVKADGAQIGVPLPTPLAPGVVEPNGSNWTMEYFRNASGYEGWVLHVVKKVQSVWDLKA